VAAKDVILRGITHEQSDHVRLKMEEVNHQDEHRELGGFPRRLLEPLRPTIHSPVFIVAIDGEIEIEAEEAISGG